MDEMRSYQMMANTDTMDMPAHVDYDLDSCADFISVAEEDTACDSRDEYYDDEEQDEDDIYDLQSLVREGQEMSSVMSETATTTTDIAPPPMPAMSLFLQNLVKSSSHHHLAKSVNIEEGSGDDMSVASFGSSSQAEATSVCVSAGTSSATPSATTVPPPGPITLQVDNAIRQDDGKTRLLLSKSSEREQRKQQQNVSRWEAIPAEPKKPLHPASSYSSSGGSAPTSSSLPLRRPRREESNRELVQQQTQQRWMAPSSSSSLSNRIALGLPMRRPQREASNSELVEQQLHRRWLSPTVTAPDTSRRSIHTNGTRSGFARRAADRPIKPPTRGNSDHSLADNTLRKPLRRKSQTMEELKKAALEVTEETAGKPDIPIRPPVRMSTSEQQIRQLAQIAAAATAAIDSSDSTNNSDGTTSVRKSKLETSSPCKGGGAGGEDMQNSITLLNAAIEAALQGSIDKNPHANNNGRPEDQDDEYESNSRRHSCPMSSPRVLSFIKHQKQLEQHCVCLPTARANPDTPKQVQRAKSLPAVMSGVLRKASELCEGLERFEHMMV